MARLLTPLLPDPAPWPTLETRIKFAQMEEAGCVQIAFLGTSVTESAVRPDAFDVPSYNAAVPFTTQASMRLWAEEFVVPEICPETVVIGLPAWSVEFIEGRSTSDPLLHGLSNVIEYRSGRESIEGLLRHSALWRLRAEIKEIGDHIGDASRRVPGRLTDSGWQAGYAERSVGQLPPEDPTISVGRVDLTTLAGLVTWLQSKDVTVVLMLEPARCDPGGTCPRPEVRHALAGHYRELAAASGVPLLDVWSTYDGEEYADAAHLNGRGATRFSAALRAALADLGIDT